MHVYRRQCDRTVWAFTVALTALLPVSYLTISVVEQDLPLGGAGLTVFGLVPLLVLPFAAGAQRWALHAGPAVRWLGRTALRYALLWLLPTALLYALPTAGNLSLGEPDSALAEYFQVALVFGATLGLPTLLALLVVAPWAASRHRAARPALIVLANLFPLAVFLVGGFPALFVIIANVVFACRATPAAVTPRQETV